MEYVKINGNSVSLIGQGGSNLGKESFVDYEDNIRIGVEYGMTLIDTAEVYGGGESEKIIGKAIKGFRDNVFICTKIATENLSSKEDILFAAENSLKRLDCDVIDLYQIHWPNTKMDVESILSAFDKLYNDGKVRYFGVSNFSPDDFKKISIGEPSFGKFIFNQIEYNLFNRSAEESIIPYFEDNDVKIISWAPLDRGNIIKDNRPVLDSLSLKYNRTVSQISLNWLYGRGIVAIPFSSSAKHIIENATSCDFEIDREDLDLIDREVRGEVIKVIPSQLIIALDGFGDHAIYHTKEEAIENKHGFCPSPKELANFLLKMDSYELSTVKPIRVINRHGCLEVLEGRVRYWAWRIAFEDDVLIAAYIVKGDDSNG